MGSKDWIGQNNFWTGKMMSDLDCAKEQIRVLEFRNAKLHQHNEKIEREIIELRDKIKKLESDAVDQFRNKGDI